jgi:hypothetical protein
MTSRDRILIVSLALAVAACGGSATGNRESNEQVTEKAAYDTGVMIGRLMTGTDAVISGAAKVAEAAGS